MNHTTEAHLSPIARAKMCQFLREEGFARVKPRRAKWSATDTIGEALRQMGHCPHVPEAKVPICHYGIQASDLERFTHGLLEQSKTVKVRTVLGERFQRSDTPILISIVTSYQRTPEERESDDVKKWIQSTIDWLKHRYGENLVAVLEHTDETYIHVHAFVHNFGKSVKPLMAGHKEVLQAQAAGVTGKALGATFKAGLVSLLDSYHDMVGAPLGMLRKSDNPRRRLSRPEYLFQKETRLSLLEQQLEAEARRLKTKADAMAANEIELNSKTAKIHTIEMELHARSAAVEAKNELTSKVWKAVQARAKELIAWGQRLNAKEVDLEKKSRELGERVALFERTQLAIIKLLDDVQRASFREGIKKLLGR